MRYLYVFFLSVVALATLVGCGGGASTATPTTDSPRPNQMPPANPNITPPSIQATLTGNAWILVSYGPADAQIPAAAKHDAFLRFNETGEISGNTGCNSLSGKYTLDGSSIRVSDLAMTMMACEDPVGQQESEVLEALRTPERYVIEDRLLKIFYAGGEKVLIYAADLPKL